MAAAINAAAIFTFCTLEDGIMVEKVIGIVGLGLIGGSFAKAIHGHGVKVLGWDIKEEVVKCAMDDKVIDGELASPSDCDVLVLALYPGVAAEYVATHKDGLKNGLIITDFCGVKRSVYSKIEPICKDAGAYYIGAHPMAGKERWGYDFADESLFKDASMLLTPAPNAPSESVDFLHELCMKAGFTKVIVTTPEEHDRIIAYTSQLAHIVSGAYMKSPTAESHEGFSAGSYRDLTRVARLNENMWTELFLDNSENLSREISVVIEHLEEYKRALDNSDAVELKALLREGRVRKETIG